MGVALFMKVSCPLFVEGFWRSLVVMGGILTKQPKNTPMKVLITILFVCASVGAMSQIQVNESNCNEVKTMRMRYLVLESCEDYVLVLYRDIRYEHLVEYESFYIPKEDFEDFYSIVTEGYTSQKSKFLTLAGQEITLSYTNSYVQFIVNRSQSTYLSRKQLDKFFGPVI